MTDNVTPIPGVVHLTLEGPELAVVAGELLVMLAAEYQRLAEIGIDHHDYEGLPESLDTDPSLRLLARSIDMRVADREGEPYDLSEPAECVQGVLVSALRSAARRLAEETRQGGLFEEGTVRDEARRIEVAVDLLDRVGWPMTRASSRSESSSG